MRFGPKACWVANLVPAPQDVERDAMAEGVPPLQPAKHCGHPQGRSVPRSKDLSVVWLAEGNAAALKEKGEIVAIIPGWSGINNFSGYARDAIGTGPFAAQLHNDMNIYERVAESAEFWESWNKSDPFAFCQSRQMRVYESTFGPCTQYYAIDNHQFPTRGLYTRNDSDGFVAATVGMSLLPMPVAEMYADNSAEIHRVELGLMLDRPVDAQTLQHICNSLSGHAAMPWQQISWWGQGHTANFTFKSSSPLDNVVLTSHLTVFPPVPIGPSYGDKVNFLWMVPISDMERLAFHTAGDGTLIDRLQEIGDAALSLDREVLG